MSFVIVGNPKNCSLATRSVFPACAEKQIVVANSKKDMQNTLFISGFS